MLTATDAVFVDDAREKAELTARFASLEFTRTLFGYRGPADDADPQYQAALARYLTASRRSKMRMESRDPAGVRTGASPFGSEIR